MQTTDPQPEGTPQNDSRQPTSDCSSPPSLAAGDDRKSNAQPPSELKPPVAPNCGPVGAGGVEFNHLRAANVERQKEWCPEQIPDLSFRGNELAGETGEACNVIKKLERERHGWRGSRGTVEHLAEELADVIITADLVAIQCGIDLGAAVVAKFNATSIKNGLSTRLGGGGAEPVENDSAA